MSASSTILATAVPAVWGFGALYLIWGTEKSAPFHYPILMGAVAATAFLTFNEVPVWFPDTITDEIILNAIKIMAIVVGVEILTHTIHHYKLGHRSKLVKYLIAIVLSRLGPAIEDDGGEEPPAERRGTKLAGWLGKIALRFGFIDRDDIEDAEALADGEDDAETDDTTK